MMCMHLTLEVKARGFHEAFPSGGADLLCTHLSKRSRHDPRKMAEWAIITRERLVNDQPRSGLPGPLRSVLAVIAGLAVVIIASTVTDEIMHATGIIPRGAMWDPWHNALALAYRCVITI